MIFFCFSATAYSSSREPRFLLPIIAAWLLACLVLANAYSGLFYSLLTLPKTERPVDTTEQMFAYLDAHPQLKVVVSPYTERLFLGASRQQNALYARIGGRIHKYDTDNLFGRNLLIYKKHFFSRRYKLNFELFEMADSVIQRQALTFLSRVYYATMLHNYGIDIGHLSEENLNAETQAIALPKRSPLLRPFNWA